MPRSGLTRIKDSGTWKSLKGLWIKDKGAWSPVQNAWTKVDGVWKKVYPTPIAIGSSTPTSATFSAYTSETSSSQSFTISNTGTEDLVVKAVANAVTGFTINFDWTTFGGEPTALNQITIPPGTTKSFSVTVTAGVSTGAKSGSFTLTANAGTLGDTTITASLSVTVLQRYSRASTVASLSFAYDTGNALYPTKTLRITNTGNQTLNVSSITSSTETLRYLFSNTTWTKFSFSGVPTTIAAGASADVTVTYNPKSQVRSGGLLGSRRFGQSGGSYSGTISINSDSDQGAITVACDMTEIVHGTVRFTTAGAGTFTVPNGITSLTYTLGGGGGGGGGAADNEEPLQLGGGGGSGGVSTGTMTVTPGQIIAYTVGAGGAGGGVPGTGGTGGTSTMNSTNATGGVGGASSGVGGAGGTGNYVNGSTGGNGQYWTASASVSQGGSGVASGFPGGSGAGGGYDEDAERGLPGTAGTAGYVEIRY